MHTRERGLPTHENRREASGGPIRPAAFVVALGHVLGANGLRCRSARAAERGALCISGLVTPAGAGRRRDVKNLTRPSLLYLKAALFVVAGVLAAALLFVRQPSVTTSVLLVVTVWAFCRAYYFAFYVVERYVDASYRFSGLMSFVRYLATRRRGR